MKVNEVLPSNPAVNFSPTPDALWDYDDALGLTPADRLVALAIWRHERLGRAFPEVRGARASQWWDSRRPLRCGSERFSGR